MKGSSYTPVAFRGFGGGLNVRDKVDAVDESQAIDCLNVIFTERGAVGQRDGYGHLAAGLVSAPDSLGLVSFSSGTRQLLAGCGTRLEAISTSGEVIASQTGLAHGPWSFARIGTPNSESVYAGNGTDILQKWSGSAWSAPAGTPQAGALAATGSDNRLVAAGFDTVNGGPDGAVSSPSHVYFSAAGAPETWPEENFVALRPGDGGKIQALASWRGDTYAFKESSFYVFYNTTVDSTGGPVFNYRAVESGVGAVGRHAVAVGRDGVYFLGRGGVYRTQGSEPELLSDLVAPLFLGGLDTLFTGSSQINHGPLSQAAVAWHDERLYVSVPTGSQTINDRMLVYDTRYKWWSVWDLKAADMVSFRVSDSPDLCFAVGDGTNSIGWMNAAFTDDAGTAISSQWRSGWSDFGSSTAKTIRETKIWGRGRVRVGVARDFAFAPTTTLVDFSTIAPGVVPDPSGGNGDGNGNGNGGNGDPPPGTDFWGDGTGTDLWGDGTGSDLWGGG